MIHTESESKGEREREYTMANCYGCEEGVVKHKIIVEWVLAKMNDCVNAD